MKFDLNAFIKKVGIEKNHTALVSTERLNEYVHSFSPIDNSFLGGVKLTNEVEYDLAIDNAKNAFDSWRTVPAPKRGELIRLIANALREHKTELAELVSWEVGKIRSEGEGEIQEAIDIADFAVGLSRQLYGLQMQSERAFHRMSEQWHPLGIVGVITAFNFPAAVWAWNAFIAAICGDVIVWKPSELAPLTAWAMNAIAVKVAEENGYQHLFQVVYDDSKKLGERLAQDKRVPLISATGSCAMGRSVGKVVAERLGKTILELGGNNAVIITECADVKMAITSTVFGSVGTAGQRCTTTRRLFVHRSLYDQVLGSLVKGYAQVKIGNPLEQGVLMGPLINERAVDQFKRAIESALSQGGEVIYGGKILDAMPSKLYVTPTIIKVPSQIPVVFEETFAPILYVIPYDTLDGVITDHNAVPQGLSSAMFTNNLQLAERFLSPSGSDCGIANVNLGTSGAEIGGAFGGEKDTGGGRESGSDAWKAYMRRQTSTVNFGNALPLAQGVKFEVEV